MKIRATISGDFDAEDFTDGAAKAAFMETWVARIAEHYSGHSFDVKRRRDNISEESVGKIKAKAVATIDFVAKDMMDAAQQERIIRASAVKELSGRYANLSVEVIQARKPRGYRVAHESAVKK